MKGGFTKPDTISFTFPLYSYNIGRVTAFQIRFNVMLLYMIVRFLPGVVQTHEQVLRPINVSALRVDQRIARLVGTPQSLGATPNHLQAMEYRDVMTTSTCCLYLLACNCDILIGLRSSRSGQCHTRSSQNTTSKNHTTFSTDLNRTKIQH